METQIRLASFDDLTWINAKYREVKFPEANLENEIIAIVESNIEKIGVGRLRRIDNNIFELSGMYVEDAYRKKGIAGKVIEFLLTTIEPHQSVYCLPFSHLNSYYKKYGFDEINDCSEIPKGLKDKQKWCGNTFGGSFSVFKYNHLETPK